MQGDLGITGVQWGSETGGSNQRTETDNGQPGVMAVQKQVMPRGGSVQGVSAQAAITADAGLRNASAASMKNGSEGSNQRTDNVQSGHATKQMVQREIGGRGASLEGASAQEVGKTDLEHQNLSAPIMKSGSTGDTSDKSGNGGRHTGDSQKMTKSSIEQIQNENDGGTEVSTREVAMSMKDEDDGRNGEKSVQSKEQSSSSGIQKNMQESVRCVTTETRTMEMNGTNQVQRSYAINDRHSTEIIKDDEVTDDTGSKQIPHVSLDRKHAGNDTNVRGNHHTSVHNQVVVHAEVYPTRSQTTNLSNENGKDVARTAIGKANQTTLNPSMNSYRNEVVVQAEVYASGSHTTNLSNENGKSLARAGSSSMNQTACNPSKNKKTVLNGANIIDTQPVAKVSPIHTARATYMGVSRQASTKGKTPPASSKDLEKKVGKDTSPELFSLPEELDIQSLQSDVQTVMCSTPNDAAADGNIQSFNLNDGNFHSMTDVTKKETLKASRGNKRVTVQPESHVSKAMSCANENGGLVNNAHQRNNAHDLQSVVGCHGNNDIAATSSLGGQSDFSPSFPPMDSQMLRLVDEVCAQNDAIAKTASPDLQQRSTKQACVNLSKMPVVSFNTDLGTLEVNQVDLETCPIQQDVDVQMNTEQLLDDAVAMDTSDSFDFPADEDVEEQNGLSVSPQEVVPSEPTREKKKSPISPVYSQLQADMELAAHWSDSFSCEESSPQPQQVAKVGSTTCDAQVVRHDDNFESSNCVGQEGAAVTSHDQLAIKVTSIDGSGLCAIQSKEGQHCRINKAGEYTAMRKAPSAGQQFGAMKCGSSKLSNSAKPLRDRRKSSNCDITSTLQDQFSPGTMAMLDMFAGEDDSGVQYRSTMAPKQMANGQNNTKAICTVNSTEALSSVTSGKQNERGKGIVRLEQKSEECSEAIPRKGGRKRKSDEFVINECIDSAEEISPPKKNKDDTCDKRNEYVPAKGISPRRLGKASENDRTDDVLTKRISPRRLGKISGNDGTDVLTKRISPRRLGKTSGNDRTPEGGEERRTSDGDFIPPTPPKEKPNTPKLLKGTLKKNGKTPRQSQRNAGMGSRRASQRIRTQVQRSQSGASQVGRGKGKTDSVVKGASKTRTAKKTLHLSPPEDSQALFSEGFDESQLCDMNKALDASDLDLRLDTSSDSAPSPKDQRNRTIPSSPRMPQSSPTIPCTDGAFTIIDVCSNKELFETFLKEWRSKMEYSFSLACEPYQPPVTGGGIGGNFRRGEANIYFFFSFFFLMSKHI